MSQGRWKMKASTLTIEFDGSISCIRNDLIGLCSSLEFFFSLLWYPRCLLGDRKKKKNFNGLEDWHWMGGEESKKEEWWKLLITRRQEMLLMAANNVAIYYYLIRPNYKETTARKFHSNISNQIYLFVGDNY